jgi:hypothetical protein
MKFQVLQAPLPNSSHTQTMIIPEYWAESQSEAKGAKVSCREGNNLENFPGVLESHIIGIGQ